MERHILLVFDIRSKRRTGTTFHTPPISIAWFGHCCCTYEYESGIILWSALPRRVSVQYYNSVKRRGDKRLPCGIIHQFSSYSTLSSQYQYQLCAVPFVFGHSEWFRPRTLFYKLSCPVWVPWRAPLWALRRIVPSLLRLVRVRWVTWIPRLGRSCWGTAAGGSHTPFWCKTSLSLSRTH